MSFDAAEAAKRLGVPESEVAAVRDTMHGPVVTTTDGRAYIVTDNGNLAFYESGPQDTAFPVFVPAAEPEEPAVDVDGDGVPDGSARQVTDWVNRGEDADEVRDRAAMALAAERGKGDDARSTLVAALEKLVG
jgi:hypothetical protein